MKLLLIISCIYYIGCSGNDTSTFTKMPHTYCLIGSRTIDCSNGNLYYINGKECAMCGDSSDCLGVPAIGEPATGICMEVNP